MLAQYLKVLKILTQVWWRTLVENLVLILPKPPNNYSIITVIKYYEHTVQGDHFNLTSALIFNYLKSNKFQKQLAWTIYQDAFGRMMNIFF